MKNYYSLLLSLLYVNCNNSLQNDEINNHDALLGGNLKKIEIILNKRNIGIEDYNQIIKDLDSLKQNEYEQIVHKITDKKISDFKNISNKEQCRDFESVLKPIIESIKSINKIQSKENESLQKTKLNHFVNIAINKEQDKNINNYEAYLNRKIHFNYFLPFNGTKHSVNKESNKTNNGFPVS